MDDNQRPNPTVLVVEDYEDSRFTMRIGLEEQGFRILEASDGEQAIEIALRERPAVILMDLSLPGLDGLEATSIIRSNPEMRDTPIVAVTAHIEADYRAKALAAGCNAYVTKPIDFSFLNDLIKNLLT
ncbi:MAG TPA: response regulator [Pyrinomonadaceae bacterium]|nr:response regulator [Pyrinomonadaceae bacterium]